MVRRNRPSGLSEWSDEALEVQQLCKGNRISSCNSKKLRTRNVPSTDMGPVAAATSASNILDTSGRPWRIVIASDTMSNSALDFVSSPSREASFSTSTSDVLRSSSTEPSDVMCAWITRVTPFGTEAAIFARRGATHLRWAKRKAYQRESVELLEMYSLRVRIAHTKTKRRAHALPEIT